MTQNHVLSRVVRIWNLRVFLLLSQLLSQSEGVESALLFSHRFFYRIQGFIIFPSIVIGALGTVTKGLENLEITGRVGTVQTTALLKSTRILRRVLKT